jgi:hypothetical protein
MSARGTSSFPSARACSAPLLLLGLVALTPAPLAAQGFRIGTPVGADVKTLYEQGLEHLSAVQGRNGAFPGGAGVTGIALMAYLAGGEDPNHGRYAERVRGAVRAILNVQDGTTGFIPESMYHHGFAMLALAEAYGAVDERMLRESGPVPRSIGEALELAVHCAVTSQEQNPQHAWRYTPDSSDADTSVSGAVLMGLLAARNAGIVVPDTAIDGAIEYFRSMTMQDGSVGYSGFGGGDSLNRSAIATAALAVAKRKDLPAYTATLSYLRDRVEHESSYHAEYFRYYMAQALFQGDPELWRRWSRDNTQRALEWQRDDGAIHGPGGDAGGGPGYATGMMLLSVALEYCFLPVYER